jgi:SAM-dependent methyltransferase
MADSDAARLANIASYSRRDAIHGSPHLNHASVWAIYQRMVRAALKTVPSRPNVLDLGAGDGTASRLWVEAKAHLTAVDSSGEQLSRLRKRYPDVVAVESDGLDFLSQHPAAFDVVSHVSMLHHIPDYLSLLKASSARVARGGALLTFQDPLRYDRLPRGHYLLGQSLYIPWRLTQGNVLRGVGNRIRRARVAYRPESHDDQEEYHVVRNGVDSEKIVAQLVADFTRVEVEVYFSSQARLAQWAGERLGIRSTFGVLATGRL